jgi:putative membrane protein
MKIRFIVVSTALLLAAACATNDTMTSSSSMPGMPGNSRMWSDSDIAGIVRTANQGEVDQGQTASTRATSADVRAFAQMMVTDHTNALSQGTNLFSRNNIAPNDNDLSRNLQSNSQQAVSALSTYSGAEFDRQYIQSQIDMHQWLLSSLDNTLIPATRNRDLRNFLQTQRASVAAHLERARQIQGSIGR